MGNILHQLALLISVGIIYYFLVYITFIKRFKFKIHQWIFIILVNFLTIMIIWCYFAIKCIKHKVPPRFWVTFKPKKQAERVIPRDSTWTTPKTAKRDSAWYARASSRIDATTASSATRACWDWTTTAPGSASASALPIGSSSFCC